MRLLLTPRQTLTLIAAICFGLLGFGLILQNWQHIEPCPMCIMQRYAFLVTGVIALLGAAHGAWPRFYALLATLSAMTGAGIAVRQSWLQWFPPKFVECGPDLEFMLNGFPLGKALPMIFAGSGDCAKVDWTFLGLSIANLAALWFAACIVLALSVFWRLRRRT